MATREDDERLAVHEIEDREYAIQVGAAAKDVREAAGYTQRTLAKKIGVSPQTVSHVEKGRINVNLQRMRRWATACWETSRFLENADHLRLFMLLEVETFTATIGHRDPDEVLSAHRARLSLGGHVQSH